MNSTDEKVSVVMPVYNTPEENLSVSVDSVLKQTHSNIELIIIDDGSERNCAEYCDGLKSKDKRINVILQNNSGVSNARNRGTEIATGNYVMYVDSDDIIGKTVIQEGLHCLTETGASFAFAAIQHISSYNQFSDELSEEASAYFVYAKDEIDKIRSVFLALRNKEFSNIKNKGFVNRGPYARLIRKEIATRVKFNEKLKIGEDVEWNMRLLNESDSVCFVKNVWYGYLIYQTSSLRKYYGNRARILEEYHRTLYDSNKDYCNSHMNEYVYNVVTSFYSLVLYEYLPAQNPKSEKERIKEIKQLFQVFPWNLMLGRKTIKSIPIQFVLFLVSCKSGCCLPMLRLWKKIKGRSIT